MVQFLARLGHMFFSQYDTLGSHWQPTRAGAGRRGTSVLPPALRQLLPVESLGKSQCGRHPGVIHSCLVTPQCDLGVGAAPSPPWAAGCWTGPENWEGMMAT